MTLRAETELRPAPDRDLDLDLVEADDAAGNLMGRGAVSIVAAIAGSVRAVRDSPLLRTITTAYRQFFLWPVDLRVRIYRTIGLYLAEQRRFFESSLEAGARSPVASVRELEQQIVDLCRRAPVLATSDIEIALARHLIGTGRVRYGGRLNRTIAHYIVETFLGDPERPLGERLDERTRYMISCLEYSRDAATNGDVERTIDGLQLLMTQQLSAQTTLAGFGLDHRQELAWVESEEDFVNRTGEAEAERRERLRGAQADAIVAGTPLVVGADGYFRPAVAGESSLAYALGPPEADGSIWAAYNGQVSVVRQAPAPPSVEAAARVDRAPLADRLLRSLLRQVVDRLLEGSPDRADEYTRSVTALYASLYASTTVDGPITGADLRNGLDTTVFGTDGRPLFRLSISPVIAEASPPESRSIDL